MLAWIGVQRDIEHEDVLQDAYTAFARNAPNHPDLLADDDLRRVLAYLRQCVKTALLMQLRPRRNQPSFVPIDTITDLTTLHREDELTELRLVLRAAVADILHTDEEQIVFRCYFEYGMKPQEIATQHPEHFHNVTSVNTVVQRLTRRLRNNSAIQQLRGTLPSARQNPLPPLSLEIRTLNEQHEEHTVMQQLCDIDEALLLDYVLGIATDHVRDAIERSAACMAAAQRLAGELLPLTNILYRLECPDVERLVAFQEQRLSGTEQLIIRQHLTECPLCQRDYALLAAIDTVPLEAQPSFVQRVVEALFQPPAQLAQGLRGDILYYQAPEVAVNLSMRRGSGKLLTWTLRGQVRRSDGQTLHDVVQAVVLRSLDRPAQEQQGVVTDTAAFSFQGIAPGQYSLHILTTEEEITIRRIAVGDDG